jgi:type III secretion protein V
VEEIGVHQAAQADAEHASAPAEREFAPSVPLVLELSSTLEGTFAADSLNAQMLNIRKALYLDLGVPFPAIQLRYSTAAAPGTYAIVLSDVPVSQGQLIGGHGLARTKAATLDAMHIHYQLGKRFLPGVEPLWVADEDHAFLQSAGISTLDTSQILAYHLAYVLKKHAPDFLGIQETKSLLSALEASHPDLVKELTRILPMQKIADIMQRLVAEDISIRNLRTIFEALIDWGQKEKDSVLLTEYVRGSLKRYICHKFAGENNILPAYILDQTVEDTVRNAIRQTSAGSYLTMDAVTSATLVANIKAAVGDLNASAQRPVLLTSIDIRRYMRKLIEADLFDLPVLSYQELTQDINIQSLAKVDL